MKNFKKNSNIKLLTLFLFIAFSFSSCSKDDDSGSNDDCPVGASEIPTDLLGEYTGVLTLNAIEVLNLSGSATITESSCKTYEIDFSDDVPSITDLIFISNNSTERTYTYTNTVTTVVINEAEEKLTVAKTGLPLITFTGTK